MIIIRLFISDNIIQFSTKILAAVKSATAVLRISFHPLMGYEIVKGLTHALRVRPLYFPRTFSTWPIFVWIFTPTFLP
jgi:hypothetical protein